MLVFYAKAFTENTRLKVYFEKLWTFWRTVNGVS